MLSFGEPPFLECSTAGDKRFSAFCARIEGRQAKTIESIYQAAKVFNDGSTNLTWRQAKGLKPVNKEETAALYSKLWDEYIDENPHLLEVLKQHSGLSDVYGKKNGLCQARELWRIRNSR